LSLLSWHATTSSEPRLAAQLLGAAEALGAGAGTGLAGPAMPHLAQANEAAADALGTSTFDAEYTAGRRMDREAALRLALRESEQAGTDTAAEDHRPTGPLGKREVEVAELIAEGLTNRQIGTRLFISERTVATHVRNILDKLGFDSRAQIASWMASSAP
jgi:DNA-binding NarL/FixJ family response regulator